MCLCSATDWLLVWDVVVVPCPFTFCCFLTWKATPGFFSGFLENLRGSALRQFSLDLSKTEGQSQLMWSREGLHPSWEKMQTHTHKETSYKKTSKSAGVCHPHQISILTEDFLAKEFWPSFLYSFTSNAF